MTIFNEFRMRQTMRYILSIHTNKFMSLKNLYDTLTTEY